MIKEHTKMKKGDMVAMIVGKDKGKKGKVIRLLTKKHRVIVDGLNLVKKHKKPTKQGEKGEMVFLPRAVDISNVALFCNRCAKPVKISYEFSGDKKIRICRKCHEAI
jgi:large subunit ribosomal protein L24